MVIPSPPPLRPALGEAVDADHVIAVILHRRRGDGSFECTLPGQVVDAVAGDFGFRWALRCATPPATRSSERGSRMAPEGEAICLHHMYRGARQDGSRCSSDELRKAQRRQAGPHDDDNIGPSPDGRYLRAVAEDHGSLQSFRFQISRLNYGFVSIASVADERPRTFSNNAVDFHEFVRIADSEFPCVSS